MDRLLRTLVSRAWRRGFAGEPIWLAVAVAAWMVRRARNQGPDVVWKGHVAAGERLVISTVESGAPRAPDSDGE